MLRILQLNDEPWDSGITAYFLQISKILKEDGHDVVLGVRPGKKPDTRAREMDLRTLPVSSFIDVVRVFRGRPWDVVNVHTGRTHTWAVLARLLLGHRANFPVIRTRGDSRPLKTTFLNRFVYQRTRAVIAASDHVRRQYESGFRFNEEEARTIYPSVFPEEIITSLPENVVGILGRLDPVKGHTAFLEAAAKVLRQAPDVQFLIGGKEAGVSVDILKNHVRELGIEKSVQFLGFQPSIEEFMKRCTMGVIASLGSEEVSRVCLEWMAASRPVVGTLVGCLPELIEPQETGLLVPPGDSIAMSEAILKLLKNPFLALRWGQAGGELALRRFSPQVQLEKTLRMYDWAIRHHADS